MKLPAPSGSKLNDPASWLKSQSRIVCFEGCEIWFSGEKVMVDTLVPLSDLRLREFARPRIIFEGGCYFLSEKSQSSSTPTIYRYVLTPWPKNDETITATIVLDEDYFGGLAVDRSRARRESMVFKALVVFYPFLGFLWSPQKRVLNRIGFEAHALSGVSTYTGFLIGFSCAVFLVIFGFGAMMFPIPLLIGTVAFLVDAVARFDRLLVGKDQIPPGFYEWLLRRKDSFE